MQVNLKVIGGKNDGRVITISVPEFIIGRGEQAHLRPSSDLISRQHCSIKIANGSVTIQDMGSRNGTFINEQKLAGPYEAKVGDVLRVGRLQFEVLIDHVQAGMKKPKVNDVVDAASRTAQGRSQFSEESITDWLSDAGTERKKQDTNNDTRQFTLDETKYRIEAAHNADETNSEESKTVVAKGNEEALDDEEDSDSSGIFGFKRKRKGPMKLPDRPKVQAENTKDAAGDVLRRFFNQR